MNKSFIRPQGFPLWVQPPSLRSIWPAICREIHENCSTNQRQTNRGNTVEHQSGLKSSLLTSPPSLRSFSSAIHLLCMETAWPISGQEMKRIQQKVTTHPLPNGFTHQVLGQFSQQFVWKCAETSKVCGRWSYTWTRPNDMVFVI